MQMLNPQTVQTRDDLVRFVHELVGNLRDRPAEWENTDLPRFLDAVGAWLEDMDGFYANRGETLPVQPEWKTFAEILAAARIYE